MKKIGILGGTFNPIHNGHLNIADAARKHFDLDEIWFLPAGIPPHKNIANEIDPRERLEMVQCAIRNVPHFKLCDIEISKKTPCYSWETLETLYNIHHKDTTFYFIIGEDSFFSFEHWVHPERICRYCKVIVAGRPMKSRESEVSFKNHILNYQNIFHTEFLRVPVEEMDISSSMLRSYYESGENDLAAKYLPQTVHNYIIERQLYEPIPTMEQIASIQKELKKELKHDRYEHTMGVMYTAANLAFSQKYPPTKAMMAGLLHDCAKCMSDEERLSICKENDIEVRPIEIQHPHLLHGKVGAYLAKTKYGICDPQILRAIAVHTTGVPEMSLLDKIIYIADYIEPNRYKATNLSAVRELAYKDLDACLLRILKDTIEYLQSDTDSMDPLTLETYAYYCRKTE